MKDECDHGCHGQLLCCMRGRFRSRVHRPIVVLHEMDVTVSCAHACPRYVSLHVSASARKTKALTSAFESKIVEALFTPRRLFEVEELRLVALVASDCRCSRSFIFLFYVFRPLCESGSGALLHEQRRHRHGVHHIPGCRLRLGVFFGCHLRFFLLQHQIGEFPSSTVLRKESA